MSQELEIPRESLLVKLNQRMTIEFDKILTDARGINKAVGMVDQAERNQDEIESLIEETLTLGNQMTSKMEVFKEKFGSNKNFGEFEDLTLLN